MARKPSAKAETEARSPLSAQCRVVLLVGPEFLMHLEQTEALRDALTKAYGGLGLFAFDGATAEAAEVLDECRTFGLMVPHKLVILDNADQFLRPRKKAGESVAAADGGGEDSEGGDLEEDEEGGETGSSRNRELLERYIQSPSEGATLLLRSQKGFNLGRLKAAIERVGAIVRCSLIDPDVDKGPTGRALGKDAAARLATTRAVQWAIRRAADVHKSELAPNAAELLVERVGPHLARLDGELAKLALNATADRSKPGTITSKAVAEMVGMSREEEVWVIQSALLSHDPAVALRSIREALDVSRHHPVFVSWACVDLARKLHGATRALAVGMNEWQMRGTLRLWGDTAEAIAGAAKRLSPAQAARLLRQAVESDARSKSGSDPERSLEALALTFASV